tara:strand:- start:126 stop:2207 length:2082 start_codon:yes stop_codon:yes gene_type:complete
MTTLSELFPAGGGGNTSDFVASGTLPNGKPVILKANGQVEVVAGSNSYSSTTLTTPIASAYAFSTARSQYNNVQWDPSDSTKFVVAWTDGASSNSGYAAVGSVSGDAITFGTSVQFDSSLVSDMDANAISFDPNQSGRFVIFYSGGGGQGSRAIVGTRSGTNLSFGTSAQVFTSTAVQPSIEFDPNTSGQFLMNWGDSANNLRVGALSGTTLSFGTLVTISASFNQSNLAVDPTNAGKYVIVYQDGADSDHGYAAVITVSGTTPSMGTPVKFLSSACISPHVVYDSGVSNAFVIVFVDNGDSNKAKAVAGVVSGTSLSVGTRIEYNTTSSASTMIAADPNNTGTFVATSDDGVGRATVLARSSTNTVTAGTSYALYNAANTKGAIEFNPSTSKTGQFVYVTEDRSASPYVGKAVIGQLASTLSTNLTSTNFLGTATAAYTNGQTASIMLKGGISDNQTSLTAGSTYYVQPTGTFATSAGTPSVLAGKAVSATSLLLNGLDEIPSQTSQSGKFLTTDGSAASWGTVASGLVHISTVSASGASAVTVSGMNSTYDRYIIKGDNLQFSSNNINFRARFNGSTSSTGGVRFGLALGLTTFYKAEGGDFELIDTVSNDADNNTSFSFETGSVNDYGHQHGTAITTTSVDSSGDAGVRTVVSGGSLTGINTTLTSMQFVVNSGTITGKFRLYGVSKAND